MNIEKVILTICLYSSYQKRTVYSDPSYESI